MATCFAIRATAWEYNSHLRFCSRLQKIQILKGEVNDMANCEGCFANCNGLCGVLTSKPLGKCRFYKTEVQVAKERRESEKRLKEIGKTDLIHTYLVK